MNRPYSGFSLTEVLVSIVVLAIGMLGVARMQLNTLISTRQMVFRSAAVQLASEMADKIRSDAALMDRGENPFLGIDYSSSTDEPAVQSAACFNAARCSATEIAEFDIHEWEKQMQSSLPSGRARICRDDAPWDEGARSYRWECSDSGPMVVKIGWRGRTADSAPGGNGRAFAPAIVMSVGAYPA